MDRWPEVKLKELCDAVTVGFVGSMADEYCEDGIPFLRSQNITPFQLNLQDLKYIPESFHERIRKSTLRPGDVGIVRTGYPGTACVIPPELGEANCSDLVIVRPGKELNPHFIAAMFNSAFGKTLVGGNLVGAAQQHFNVTVAKELRLRIPPRKEQDKIAAVLGSFNDLIANNQRRIALLESMAEEIYREWFVRMRFPGKAANAPESIEPAGWYRKALGELTCLLKRGVSPNYDEKATALVVNQKCIRNGRLDLADARLHDTPTPEEKLLRYGDVLINSTGVGTLGRAAVFDLNRENITCDSHVTIARPRDVEGEGEFLAFTVQLLQSYFEAMASGSTGQAELGRDFIAKTKVLVPPHELMRAFGERVRPMRKQRRLLMDANEQLVGMRDALLPRLISGKLRVDQLDIQFPPSMKPETAEAAP